MPFMGLLTLPLTPLQDRLRSRKDPNESDNYRDVVYGTDDAHEEASAFI